MSRRYGFESELATQQSLSTHVATLALDAFEAGDTDSFTYASEIHDETQGRIRDLKAAQASIRTAFKEWDSGDPPYRVLSALALGDLVLNGDLHLN